MTNTKDVKPILWDDVEKELEADERSKKYLKKNKLSLHRYIADENNTPKVVDSLLRTLKRVDPERATLAYATNMADIMKKWSLKILKQNDQKTIRKVKYPRISHLRPR